MRKNANPETVLDDWMQEEQLKTFAAKSGKARDSDAERKWSQNDAAVLAMMRDME